LANAYMKSETKAKRRATLSFCGVSVPDESEMERDIQPRRHQSVLENANMQMPNWSKGITSGPPSSTDATISHIEGNSSRVIQETLPPKPDDILRLPDSLCHQFTHFKDFLGIEIKDMPIEDLEKLYELVQQYYSKSSIQSNKNWFMGIQLACETEIGKREVQ